MTSNANVNVKNPERIVKPGPRSVNAASGYRLIDSGGGRKLEQIGPYRLIRPAAAALWRPRHPQEWKKAHGEFVRRGAQDGDWRFLKGRVPSQWTVPWDGLTLEARRTGFGHLGLFPEHWPALPEKAPKTVLNLFAYTGATTLALAGRGARVTHVDASRQSVQWAQHNAALSGMKDAPIRWIVDDARKFVRREARRGRTYAGILLDPPSFGRGPKGEVWKLEEELPELLAELAAVAAPDLSFFQLSCHTPGITPRVLANLCEEALGAPGRRWEAWELFLGTEDHPLPSGCACRLVREG